MFKYIGTLEVLVRASRATFELPGVLPDVRQQVPDDDNVEEHRGRDGDDARGPERLGPSQLRGVHRQDGAPVPLQQ